MIDDIEDDYPDYLDDEGGYAWDAWDDLRGDQLDEMIRHDAVVASTADDLSALDPSSLNDLLCWGYARACRRLKDTEGFHEAARLIATSEASHPAIAYHEVFVALIESLCDNGLADEAEIHLARFAERWPDDSRARRLNVYLAIRGDGLEQALAACNDLLTDDLETAFEIAEDLVATGAGAAGRWLSNVESAAREQNAGALLLDISLLREELSTE